MANTKKKRLLFEDDAEITKQQNYIIAKRNDLIRNSRYTLTLSQNRLLLFLISKIKPYDGIESSYKVKIKDIIKVCEYYDKSGQYYGLIKKDLLKLRNSAVWVETSRGIETMGWLKKAVFLKPINKGDYTEVLFSFDEGLDHYLFELREYYTQFNLEEVLLLTHKYSIRLFEYLMSYANMMYCVVSIDELKERLDAKTYTNHANFKKRILLPAIEDINLHTKMYVEYDELKEGRTFSKIAFYIWNINPDSKDNTIEDMRILAGTKANVNKRLMKKAKIQIDKEKIISGEGTVSGQLDILDMLKENEKK